MEDLIFQEAWGKIEHLSISSKTKLLEGVQSDILNTPVAKKLQFLPTYIPKNNYGNIISRRIPITPDEFDHIDSFYRAQFKGLGVGLFRDLKKCVYISVKKQHFVDINKNAKFCVRKISC